MALILWNMILGGAVCWVEQGTRPSENQKSLTNKNGEEEDPHHPATDHEDDLGNILRFVILA